MIRASFVALSLASLLALAPPAHAGSTVRCGQKLVVVGDSIAQVIAACGKPDREVQLQTGFGGAAGERLEYYRDSGKKTIMVWVQAGRVVRVEEL